MALRLKPKNFSKKSITSLLIVFLFLVLTAVAVYLGLRILRTQTAEPVVTENVPDLYPGREISRRELNFLRGRFIKVEDNVLFLEMARYVNDPFVEEVKLWPETAYNCISRYRAGPERQEVDRLDIFFDTSKLKVPDDDVVPPEGEDLNWFVENVKKGEAVEVYLAITAEEGRKAHTINYITERTCPNDR